MHAAVTSYRPPFAPTRAESPRPHHRFSQNRLPKLLPRNWPDDRCHDQTEYLNTSDQSAIATISDHTSRPTLPAVYTICLPIFSEPAGNDPGIFALLHSSARQEALLRNDYPSFLRTIPMASLNSLITSKPSFLALILLFLLCP